MPQPRPSAPIAAAVAAQGLRVDQVDPDHLYFLQHVRADGNSYAVDLPAGSKSPPVTVKYEPGLETPAANGEAQSAIVPSPAPAGSGHRAVEEEIPWYETAPMDKDYREFWRQTRFVDGKLVLAVGEDKVVRYMMDAGPVRLSDIADWAEKNDWAQKKGGEEVAAIAALGNAGDGVRVPEKEKVKPIRTDDGPVLASRVRDSPAPRQKKKVEQVQKEKVQGKGGAGKIKGVKRGQGMLNELPVETLKALTNSSNGHDVEPHSAPGFHGVVWPLHIMERPESSFKKKLLRNLREPFCMVEYKDMLCEASNQRKATKMRHTRRGVTYYESTHEISQSYFESYPDLAKQVQSASVPNQLALLRGFFFWLKNLSDEDQFRPWTDDFKHYTIIPLE